MKVWGVPVARRISLPSSPFPIISYPPFLPPDEVDDGDDGDDVDKL